MAAVCIFCGSATGTDPAYSQAAKEMGRLLAQSNTTLVYGGARIGLMGIVADEVLRHSGKVIGVIPHFLYEKEVGHSGVTELEIVQSMHERKKRMADLTDYFIAMPGGWGTIDELAEILTWRQLGIIHQPVGLLNINSFFDPLLLQFKKMTEAGFVKQSNLKLLTVADEPQQLLTQMGVTAS